MKSSFQFSALDHFLALPNSYSIIPLCPFPHRKAELVLHCSHIMFKIPSMICRGLLPFELTLILSSYQTRLIYSSFPIYRTHFSNSIFLLVCFLFFIFLLITLASLNFCSSSLSYPSFKGQLMTTSSVMLFWISSVKYNFFLFIFPVALSIHLLYILLQVLWSGRHLCPLYGWWPLFPNQILTYLTRSFFSICDFLYIILKNTLIKLNSILLDCELEKFQDWSELVVASWLVAKLMVCVCQPTHDCLRENWHGEADCSAHVAWRAHEKSWGIFQPGLMEHSSLSRRKKKHTHTHRNGLSLPGFGSL